MDLIKILDVHYLCLSYGVCVCVRAFSFSLNGKIKHAEKVKRERPILQSLKLLESESEVDGEFLLYPITAIQIQI